MPPHDETQLEWLPIRRYYKQFLTHGKHSTTINSHLQSLSKHMMLSPATSTAATTAAAAVVVFRVFPQISPADRLDNRPQELCIDNGLLWIKVSAGGRNMRSSTSASVVKRDVCSGCPGKAVHRSYQFTGLRKRTVFIQQIAANTSATFDLMFEDCVDSFIYILAPVMGSVVIRRCAGCVVIAPAIQAALIIDYSGSDKCTNYHADRLRVYANCSSCLIDLKTKDAVEVELNLNCINQPLVAGKTDGLTLAPLFTYFSGLEEMLHRIGFDYEMLLGQANWRLPVYLSSDDEENEPFNAIQSPDNYRALLIPFHPTRSSNGTEGSEGDAVANYRRALIDRLHRWRKLCCPQNIIYIDYALERLNAVEPSWIGEMRCKVECGNAEQTAINRRRLQKATETAFWLWLTGKRQSDDEAVVDGASNVNSRQRWREIIQLGSMEMC